MLVYSLILVRLTLVYNINSNVVFQAIMTCMNGIKCNVDLKTTICVDLKWRFKPTWQTTNRTK